MPDITITMTTQQLEKILRGSDMTKEEFLKRMTTIKLETYANERENRQAVEETSRET